MAVSRLERGRWISGRKSRHAHFKTSAIVCRASSKLITACGLLLFCRATFVIFITTVGTVSLVSIKRNRLWILVQKEWSGRASLTWTYEIRQAWINRSDRQYSSISSVSRVCYILWFMNSSFYCNWITFHK